MPSGLKVYHLILGVVSSFPAELDFFMICVNWKTCNSSETIADTHKFLTTNERKLRWQLIANTIYLPPPPLAVDFAFPPFPNYFQTPTTQRQWIGGKYRPLSGNRGQRIHRRHHLGYTPRRQLLVFVPLRERNNPNNFSTARDMRIVLHTSIKPWSVYRIETSLSYCGAN
jgi:hypothetical protein